VTLTGVLRVHVAQMSHRASPRSPPPSSHAADVPIHDRSPPTRPSRSLPSSLLRFVARDSPASVRRSWDGVRAALGLRTSSFFSSARSSPRCSPPRCSTASCDAPRDDESCSAESFLSDTSDVCTPFALFARLDSVESDVARATRRLASLERWRLSVDAFLLFSADFASLGGSPEQSRAERSASFSSEARESDDLSLVALAEKRRLEARFREFDARKPPRGGYVENTTNAVRGDDASRSFSSNVRRNIHRAKTLLHPSPPESPEGAFSFSVSVSSASDDGDGRFEARASRRSRSSAHVLSSVESIDESIDETIDGSIHDRSTFSSKMCALIEDVREVRAELARLKNVPFFRGDDDAAR